MAWFYVLLLNRGVAIATKQKALLEKPVRTKPKHDCCWLTGVAVAVASCDHQKSKLRTVVVAHCCVGSAASQNRLQVMLWMQPLDTIWNPLTQNCWFL